VSKVKDAHGGRDGARSGVSSHGGRVGREVRPVAVGLRGLLSFARTSLLSQLSPGARLAVCITMTISVAWVRCEGLLDWPFQQVHRGSTHILPRLFNVVIEIEGACHVCCES
jgi:hypothetical protein